MAETALDRLKRLSAWDQEPALSEDDLEAILDAYQTTDAAGLAPGESEWVPTYRMNAAIAEAWETKAGRATDLVSTDFDGDRMSNNQVFDHCDSMARRYRRKGAASFSISPAQ